jgi:multidrug resistance efflux pump
LKTSLKSFLVLCFFAVCSFSPLAFAGVDDAHKTTASITPRFLQYDDELHDFELYLIEADSRLGNLQLDLRLAQQNYDRVRRLYAKGYASSAAFETSKISVEQKKSEIELHALSMARLRRGKAIAEMNLKTESGEALDLVDIASQYALKWKDEAERSAIHSKMAKKRFEQERIDFEHNQKLYRSGYLPPDEFEVAINKYDRVKNDVSAAEKREVLVRNLLVEAERTLASMKGKALPPQASKAR